MPEAYLVDAVRTPVGKRGGVLSRVHPADLGAHVLRALIDRDYAQRAKQRDPAAFWARPDPAGHLAGLLIARTRELETRRLDAGAPDDKRAAFDRQELILKTFAAETGLTDEFASMGVVSEIPRTAPGEPTPAAEIEKLTAFLRTLLDLN